MDIIHRFDPYQPITVVRLESAEAAEQALRDGNLRHRSIIEATRGVLLGDDPSRPIVIPSSLMSLGITLVDGVAPVQSPFALVLGCSDARAPIELVFDRSPNELFIIRVAGNVIGTEGLASVHFAERALDKSLRLAVVLGHTGCGAVTAAVDVFLKPENYAKTADTYPLRSLIDRLQLPVRLADKALTARGGPDTTALPGYRAALLEMAVYLNAAVTAQELDRELKLPPGDPVRVVFGVYNLGTQRVEAEPDHESTFHPAPVDAEALADLARRLADSVVTRGVLVPIRPDPVV